MTERGPVSLVIPTKASDGEKLRRSLVAVSNLDPVPSEVIIVDSTDGGFPFDLDDLRCCGKGDPVAFGAEAAVNAGADVLVCETAPIGIAKQRYIGVQEANQPYVWTFDDTTVPHTENWVDRAVSRLEADNDVVGVGGVPTGSVTGSTTGNTVAWATNAVSIPVGGWRLTFPRELCNNRLCFPPTRHRGDTYTVRSTLLEHGRIYKDPALGFLDEFPTKRQKQAFVGGLAALGGVHASSG